MFWGKGFVRNSRSFNRKKDGFVGRLRKAMYGTRAAPQVWQSVVKKTLTNLGFEASIVQPCVYFHRSRDLRIVTHVDDFLCGGPKASLLWLRKQLQNEFELKSQILGDGVGEDRAVKFLGRTIRWESHGIEIEGDNKLQTEILKHQREMIDYHFNKQIKCRPSELPPATRLGIVYPGD